MAVETIESVNWVERVLSVFNRVEGKRWRAVMAVEGLESLGRGERGRGGVRVS